MAPLPSLDGAADPPARATHDGEWTGRVIAGKYQVEGVLGRGAMGIVLKARHLRLDEPVAVKVLHQSLVNDESMIARMLREARAILRLSSEHIVRLMDVDVLDGTVPFLVFEYLTGTDLGERVRSDGPPMSWEEAVGIADHACCALTEAHALGIIHRDLKPSNLFIAHRPDGRRVVKLLDFGISKLLQPDLDGPITRTGAMLGSPLYMSPEQIRGEEVDGRTDIWSIGVVLYQLLSGRLPFEGGGNLFLTAQSVTEDTPEPLERLRPDVPIEICAVVMRCLEKDRERRFPDAQALRDALSPVELFPPRSGVRASLPDSMSPRFLTGAPPPSVRPNLPSSPADLARPAPPLSPAAPLPVLAAEPTPVERASVERASVERISHERPVSRSRTFLWFALAGLVTGIVVGLVLLFR